MEKISDSCDLLREILDHIPIKQVIRMKCLSKSWCSSISRYRKSRPRVSSSTLLIQCGNQFDSDRNQVLFIQAEEEKEEGGVRMEKSLWHSMGKHISFMGSSNGLVLFNEFIEPDKLIAYVCNTSARQWDTLPPVPFHPRNPQPSSPIYMGLAFDGVPNHPYKVISLTNLRLNGKLEFQIYSSDTGEWKKKEKRIPNSSLLLQGQHDRFRLPFNIDNPHLFWRGMLLCIINQGGNQQLVDHLLVHHVQDHLFKLMRLPKKNEHHGRGGFLWESQGYLHYCQNVEHEFCVWTYDDCNLSWKTFTDMESDFGKWKSGNTVDIASLKSQHPTLISQNPVAYGANNYPNIFPAFAFDDGLQILYIILPKTILFYRFETGRLSKVSAIEQSTDLLYTAPRFLSFQLNGTDCLLGGNSISSLPMSEPQGTSYHGFTADLTREELANLWYTKLANLLDTNQVLLNPLLPNFVRGCSFLSESI